MSALPCTPDPVDVDRRKRQRSVLNADRLGARYRERDFGIGYGNSSGYVHNASYTARHTPALFRVR